jgi:hypothetical protein
MSDQRGEEHTVMEPPPDLEAEWLGQWDAL